MSIFRTGTIIITGAREMEQIYAAYEFINTILRNHSDTVLSAPHRVLNK